MEKFRHKTQIQLRFKDFDKMGYVNSANYLTYVEMGRLKYFKDVFGPIDWSLQEGIILARLEIDYKHPVLFGDDVAVYTRCSSIGKKSLQQRWKIVRYKKEAEDYEEIVAEGLAVLVCYDYTQEKSMEVTPERKRKLEQYEEVHFF